MKLVLSESLKEGKALIKKLNIPLSEAALITDPEHLFGVDIHPKEEVIIKSPIPVEFIENLNLCAQYLTSGEWYSLKVMA